MPTFLRMMEILSCSMAGFVPYLVLLFYPFRNHLRLKGFPAVVLAFVMSAAVLSSDLQAALGTLAIPVLETVALPAPFLLLLSGAFLIMAVLCIHAPIDKVLLNTFSVINLAILIHGAATNGADLYSLRWFVITLILQVVLLIPYGINLAMCLGPTLNLSKAKIWHYIWAIPAAVCAVGCGLVFAGVATKTLLIAMAIATVAAAAAAAAALYLTRTEMITLFLKREKPVKNTQHAQPAAPAVELMPDPVQLYYSNIQTRLAESEHSNKELLLQVMSMEDDLEQQDYDKVRARLNFLRKQLSATCAPSGNSRIDPILTYYTRQALISGIKIVSSITLPELCPVTDEDMAVLLGCLMDQALESCREQNGGTRRIAAATHQSDDILQIGVKNTYTEPMDEDCERMNICRQIVERYDGRIQINSNGGVTQVVVTLSI